MATASIRGTGTRMQKNSGDGLQPNTRAACLAQLFSMADSRTERLCIQLTASNSHHCIARMYIDACRLSKEINAALE